MYENIRAQGVLSLFSLCVGLGPASAVQEFQAPQKLLEILATPKNIPHFVCIDIKKRP